MPRKRAVRLEWPAKDYPMFHHASAGMTRFPPNVEQIDVKHQGPTCFLTIRRNDNSITMPLLRADCEHLASLMLGDGKASIDYGWVRGLPSALGALDPRHLPSKTRKPRNKGRSRSGP